MAGSCFSLKKGGEPCKNRPIQFVKSSEIFHTGPVSEGNHTLVAPPSHITDPFPEGNHTLVAPPSHITDPVPEGNHTLVALPSHATDPPSAARNKEMRCLTPDLSDNATCVQTQCVKDSSLRNEDIIKQSKDARSGQLMSQSGSESASMTIVSQGSIKIGDKIQGSCQGDQGSIGAGIQIVSGSVLKKGSSRLQPVVVTFPRTPEAKPILTKDQYLTLWTNEKDVKLEKFRKLAYEVVALKTERPNAKDKMHSAANRVPIHVDFHVETVLGFKNSNSFICSVFVDGVSIASGQGARIKDSKTNAYEATLQKILMPHIRIVCLDPESSQLEASKEPFTSPPCEPSPVPLSKKTSQILLHTASASEKDAPAVSSLEKVAPAVSSLEKVAPAVSSLEKVAPAVSSLEKVAPATSSLEKLKSAVGVSEIVKPLREVSSKLTESNRVAACLKRRFDERKPLDDFVIVEPLVPTPDCTPAHTLRRSADFNHMLLEYEFIFKGEAARCILRVEDQVLADINGASKLAAKNQASVQALDKLKNRCWVIKTKKAVDSDTKISKDEMLNELIGLNEQSGAIGCDNVGNRLLRKMGWAGGGVGKNGSGIVEPVTLKSVLNREGLGLSATKGITEDFKNRVKEIMENYAASGNQEDLVFDFDFRLDERQIIHNESRRLNLRSKCRGRGTKRYLCVRRKLSANELFDHIMSRGGETARYVLVPPGFDGGGEPGPGSNNSRWSSMIGLASEGKHFETYTDKFLTRTGRKDCLSRTNFTAPCSGRGLLSTPTNCAPPGRATWSSRASTREPAGTGRNILFNQAAGSNCGFSWEDKFPINTTGTDEKCVGDIFWGSSHLATVHAFHGERRMSSMGNDYQFMGNGNQNMGSGSYGNQYMRRGSYGNQNIRYCNQAMGSGYYGMGDRNPVFENFSPTGHKNHVSENFSPAGHRNPVSENFSPAFETGKSW